MQYCNSFTYVAQKSPPIINALIKFARPSDIYCLNGMEVNNKKCHDKVCKKGMYMCVCLAPIGKDKCY